MTSITTFDSRDLFRPFSCLSLPTATVAVAVAVAVVVVVVVVVVVAVFCSLLELGLMHPDRR